ncbi:HAD-IA family hydrolase [Motiliproteus sp.]|uniref:HAD-IA family hydrolase n=1 Tax=Motiliproteus sp. TaxID=1898955 RepID=UPI003BAA8C58
MNPSTAPFTLAFDVYGTLIDTHGVVAQLQLLIGDQAQAFSNRWREKQLEYAFRRGLMQNYANFATCTSQALDYTCHEQGVTLSTEQKQQLLQIYKTLPAFDDVQQSLSELQTMGCRLFAFSNGTAEAVDQLLQSAGIRQFFIDGAEVIQAQSGGLRSFPASLRCRSIERLADLQQPV